MQKHEQNVRETQSSSSLAVSRTRLMPFVAEVLGTTVLLLAYSSLTWKRFVANVGVCPQLFCDFVDYYYPMGKAIFHTGLPVEGFLYSPFNAILLAASAPLGLDASLVLWGILQVTAVILCLLLFYQLVPAKHPTYVLFAALTLFSYPLWLNFLGGNTGAFILVTLLGSLLAVERGHHLTAAILLAIAVSFKFYPIIFLVPFVAGRNARFALLGAATSILVLCVIPGLVLSTAGTVKYYGVLVEAFRASDWVAVNPHSQFFPHLALRLLGIAGAEVPTLQSILQILSYLIVAINLILAYLVQRARVHHANIWSFQIVFLTVPFILKTSWPIDFVFLPFVQSFLITHIMEKGSKVDSRESRARRGYRCAMFFLVVPSILISNVVFFNLLGKSSLYGYAGFLFLATTLLLFAIYVEFLPMLWQSHKHAIGVARSSNGIGSVA